MRDGQAVPAPMLKAAVTRFLAEAGLKLSQGAEGDLTVSSPDADLVVGQGSPHTVARVQRGRPAVFLETDDVEVVERYLVLSAGNQWRSRHGLGFLSFAGGGHPTAGDVVEHGRRRFGVRLHGREEPVAREMVHVDAREMAVALAHPVVDLIAAYRDPTGAPPAPRMSAMTVDLPADVAALVDDLGGVVSSRAEGLRIDLGDVVLRVRAEGGRFVVDRLQRGALAGVDLDTTSAAALHRFILLAVGSDWRARQRMRPVIAPAGTAPDPQGPPGVAVRAGDGWTLEWADAAGAQTAVLRSRFDAHEVAWALTATLDVVVASLRSPDGGPVFST